MAGTISLTPRRVCRVSTPQTQHKYQVFEEEANGMWRAVSKEYDHSTSAFAALGRLVQKETIDMIGHDVMRAVEKEVQKKQ